ncbi:DUF397 domain-containing protein [Streptomyces triticiradicis]|uniref:DUF397 domain-containing protein n=1 Tax=Streptomyces triticiradicis TaxID=2651189 RepID=A0A7J5D5N1_9ACTN|nr:DUF397 domain-containing protein [Streptomyces triticiradicis]KAB1979741.1 DUF397 domain-containing protein [Streptomyces triticiradicis]
MTHVTSPEDFSGLTWFKSSYSSSSEAGDCVEVALEWRRSSYSSSNGNDCVEIAPTPTAIHVRDSKDPGGARLAIAPAAWTAFVAFAAQG